MDFFFDFLTRLVSQLQSPTLGFLLGGMLLAACGSKLKIPQAIYQFIVFMLLMKIGLKGGMEIRNADLSDMFLPLIIATCIGIIVVLLGNALFSRIKSIQREDGIATAGLF